MTKKEVRNAIPIVIAIEREIFLSALLIASGEEVTIPIPRERIGKRIGAIRIAPIITIALSSRSPSVEIKAPKER